MRSALFAAALGLAAVGQASAATFDLDLTANGDGRWFEYFSDSFAQIDLDPDGFYSISQLPALVQQGTDNDVFPNDVNFTDAGVLSYDDSGLTGVGQETASITDLTIDFSQHIADDDNVLNAEYDESVTSFSGTVSLFNGQVTSIDLTADIVFTYDFSNFGFGPLDYFGTFVITGGTFDLFVDTSYDTPFGAPARYVWDFDGNVNNLSAVPVPAAAWLLGSGLLGLVGLGRRRAAR